jgi:hypothetical protein
MRSYVCGAGDGVRVVDGDAAMFFVYDPDGDLPDDRWLPFVTIVTGDVHDAVSRLGGSDYRLNIGLTKATYTSTFGAAPTERDEHGVLATGFDHTAVDRLMPHPMYASHHWVCVVNPSDATVDELRPLLAEAYDFAVRKHGNRRARQ